MDDADRAAEEEQAYLAERLQKTLEAGQSLQWRLPEGVCLNCEADLGEARTRFCDPYCAADWQHRQEINRNKLNPRVR